MVLRALSLQRCRQHNFCNVGSLRRIRGEKTMSLASTGKPYSILGGEKYSKRLWFFVLIGNAKSYQLDDIWPVTLIERVQSMYGFLSVSTWTEKFCTMGLEKNREHRKFQIYYYYCSAAGGRHQMPGKTNSKLPSSCYFQTLLESIFLICFQII